MTGSIQEKELQEKDQEPKSDAAAAEGQAA